MDQDIDGNDIYGIVLVQEIDLADSDGSVVIADSYSWFALESFWSTRCGKDPNGFDKAQKGDDDDPLCDNEVCREPDPIPNANF